MRIQLSVLCLLAATSSAHAGFGEFNPGNVFTAGGGTNSPGGEVLVQLQTVTRTGIDGQTTYYDLQVAIDDAVEGDLLELKGGPFQGPFTVRQKSHLIIRGVDEGGTVIDGNDEHRGFLIVESPGIVLEQLNVQHCRTPESRFFFDKSGAAINATYSPGLQISWCRFSNNRALRHGGGVAVWTCEGTTIDRCDFVRNDAPETGGGLYLGHGADMQVHNCVFDENRTQSYGGGVYVFSPVEGTNCQFDTCNFYRNEAESGCHLAVEAMHSFHVGIEVDHCVFSANHAAHSETKGGALFVNGGAQAMVESSVFVQHRAKLGAVAFVGDQSVLTMVSCAMMGNRSRTASDLVYSDTLAQVTMKRMTIDCQSNVEEAMTGFWAEVGPRNQLADCGYTADLSLDGIVDMKDLLIMLRAWGPCVLDQADIANTPGGPLDRVDVTDLTALIQAWGNDARHPFN